VGQFILLKVSGRFVKSSINWLEICGGGVVFGYILFVIQCVSNYVLCVCVCVSGPHVLLLDLWTESVSRDFGVSVRLWGMQSWFWYEGTRLWVFRHCGKS
jgi:hypothetical protein